MASCACGKNKNKRYLIDKELQQLVSCTSFQLEEVKALRNRFYQISGPSLKMNKLQFRENMGILGLETTSYLSDRIFDMLANKLTKQVEFKEFLKYLNIHKNGDLQQRQYLSFRLIDIDDKGYFIFKDLLSLFESLTQIWAAITGNQVSKYQIQNYNQALDTITKLEQYALNKFQQFDTNNQQKVYFEKFHEVVLKNPDILEIFHFLNKGITDAFDSDDAILQHDNKIFTKVLKVEMKLRTLINQIEKKSQVPIIEVRSYNNDDNKSDINFVNEVMSPNIFGINHDNPLNIDDIQIISPHNLSNIEPNFKINDIMSPINIKKGNSINKFLDVADQKLQVPAQKKTIFQSQTLQSKNQTAEFNQPLQELFKMQHNDTPQKKRLNTSPQLQYSDTSYISRLQEQILNEPSSHTKVKQFPQLTPLHVFEDENDEIVNNMNFQLTIKIDDCQQCQNQDHSDDQLVQIGDINDIHPLQMNTVQSQFKEFNMQQQPVSIQDLELSQCCPSKQKQQNLQQNKQVVISDKNIEKLKDIMQELVELRQSLNNNDLKGNEMNVSKESINKLNEIKQSQIAVNVPKQSKLILQNTEAIKRKDSNVYFGHQNFNLVLNMMIGIQMAVKSVFIRNDYILTRKDFKLKYYFELIPRRSKNQKDNFKICKFFDYAPYVFHEIRRLQGITNEKYLKSIGSENLLSSIIRGNMNSLSEFMSSGKSGSFFYFSMDGYYTLKTIRQEEKSLLKNILKDYYQHIEKYPNSLMVKFFGLHKILINKKQIFFIIMDNVFNTTKEIHVRYDIKGSTYKRSTSEKQKFFIKLSQRDPSIARKDLDLIKSNFKFKMSARQADIFMKQIKVDCEFFERNSIIDYSLLIGIHYLKNEKNQDQVNQSFLKEHILNDNDHIKWQDGMVSSDKKCIYFVGIIDILTEFNTTKQMEYVIKYMTIGKTISAIPPEAYSKRFQQFINNLIEIS